MHKNIQYKLGLSNETNFMNWFNLNSQALNHLDFDLFGFISYSTGTIYQSIIAVNYTGNLASWYITKILNVTMNNRV